MNTTILGLGSNINAEVNIQAAIAVLVSKYRVLQISSLMKTKPLGFAEQADFINVCVLLETTQNPETLTINLKKIETSLGRVRTSEKNGPRTIDLDILVWNGSIVDENVFTRDFLQKGISELGIEIENQKLKIDSMQ
jgi:2-amino-4-hydroxy-6-hydroxymethyldihydropteridine diphosphokinase